MQPAGPISKNALRAMIAIVLALLLVAIYANVQKLRRNRIEKATFTPAAGSATSPSSTP